VQGHIYTFTAASVFSGEVQATASDRATNPTFDTFRLVRDAAPPQMWLDVPRRVYTAAIPVAWGASDGVQVSVEGGPWSDWLTGMLATEATYVAEEGGWFTFRVTATDNVGNETNAEAQSRLARVTKYYYHGGRRVAMRAGGVVYYLHGDHLGSVSLVTDAAGRAHARRLFRPYGGTRWQAGTLPTDFGFTGQREDGSTGLVFMHARYYNARLGRFVSADTVVPEPGNPQALNRYNALGNLLRYKEVETMARISKSALGSKRNPSAKQTKWQGAADFLNRLPADRYWAAQLPCKDDARITEICGLYRHLSAQERVAFEKKVSQNGYGVLGEYSVRMAMLGAREKREERLIYGIVALTIGWTTPYIDGREILMTLAPLYHSARIVGEPRRIFEAGVQHVEDERIRGLILGFLDRNPRDQRLEVMGWKAIEGPHGLIYRFDNQPIPEGHL